MTPTVESLVELLSSYRLRFGTEQQLQCDIERTLTAAGIEFVREHVLCGASRIDFYIPGPRIGIECKTDGGQSAVYQQLIRYADHPTISGLVLVSRRRTHATNVTALRGKPFRFLWIGGGSL